MFSANLLSLVKFCPEYNILQITLDSIFIYTYFNLSGIYIFYIFSIYFFLTWQGNDIDILTLNNDYHEYHNFLFYTSVSVFKLKGVY